MSATDYEIVIGLEVHAQLTTASKLFCGCRTLFGAAANTQVCPVCLGLPGVLPVINHAAVLLTVRTAMALGCAIADVTKFDRKHYFYPDLPKNFQTSQYDQPLSHDGSLTVTVEDRQSIVRIKRIHLEEDAGKLVHQEGAGYSLVDYNRTGIPLMEIVTEPDIRSSDEAYEFLVKLKSILEYLQVSNCNMEEGSLRCDANISLRPRGAATLGTKAEIKNLNSFKAVKQALDYEACRQAEALIAGNRVIQETRLWDSVRQVTESMRSKEEAHDYRYFPEPDLMPIMLPAQVLDGIRAALPELPEAKRKKFVEEYGLSAYDAAVITAQREVADYFEAVTDLCKEPKTAANWIMGDLLAMVNEKKIPIGACGFLPADLADILLAIKKATISAKMGKELLREAVETGKKPAVIIREKGLAQITDESALDTIVERVLLAHPKALEDLRAGKAASMGFLVGQVMKASLGTANPQIVNGLLRKRAFPEG